MLYLTYFTIILISFSVLAGVASASKDSSMENRDQVIQNNSGISNINETNNTSEVKTSEYVPGGLLGNSDEKNQSEITQYEQKRQKIKEELEHQRDDYHKAKKDFLKIKSRIRSGELNPNSDEALNGTKLYLNSSINYMIAHLSNVKNNIEYSDSNGTEKIVTAIEGKIKLLETERAAVTNSSNQKDNLSGRCRTDCK
jgi:hypothetical protein